MNNQKRLFVASCLAIMATSMAFSIRADIIPALKADFGFTDTQMGQIVGPGLWGFAITIIIGGILIDLMGMARMMWLAFAGHVLGVILTITATGYSYLFIATLLIGLANGMVEAVTNPLVATLFTDRKTKSLNTLHAWWPAGLIVGGLAGYLLTRLMGLAETNAAIETVRLGWKIKMGLVLLPTLSYGFLFWGQKFPQTEAKAAGVPVSEMFREALRPGFLVFLVLMVFTVATELGPDQWIGNLLQNLVGIQGVLLLVYTAGIMFVLRSFFAGRLLQLLSPIGLLAVASVFSAIGLYSLSASTTALMVFAAATMFGVGKSFFWPTMVGVVAERFPKGGALVMGLMGGVGMFSAGWLISPAMGVIQDHYAIHALSSASQELVVHDGGIDETRVREVEDPVLLQEIDQAKQHSAIMTFRWVSLVPAVLSLLFGAMFVLGRRKSVEASTGPISASTGARS